MTLDEFRKATSELEAFYEKTLNPTQMQMWFEELSGFSVTKYQKAIRKICGTSQYRPTLSLVLETIRTVGEAEEPPKETYECKACKGTGIIIYKKAIEGRVYDYACQCNCPNGYGKGYDGSKIADKEHRSDYYLAKATDVFAVGG